jgi:death-on-curing protein
MPAFQYLGGDHGKGLLESALAQPAQTFGGRFLYRTIFDKAAVLLCSVIKNHPLYDGNKRTGLTTMGVFLALNGYLFFAPKDEAVGQCLAIASTKGTVDWRPVAKWVRSNSISTATYRSLSTQEQRSRVGASLATWAYLEGMFNIVFKDNEEYQNARREFRR